MQEVVTIYDVFVRLIVQLECLYLLDECTNLLFVLRFPLVCAMVQSCKLGNGFD